jgi:hypothetical protein
MQNVNAEYELQAAVMLKDNAERNRIFYRQLEAAQKPFGARQIALAVGTGVGFLTISIALGFLLFTVMH